MAPPYAATVRRLNPKAEIFTPVAELLESATNVKSFFLEKTANRPTKSYDWEPSGGPFDGPSLIGDVVRSLFDVSFTVDIHCRAPSFDEAWTMVEDLVTALGRKVQFAFQLQGLTVGDASGESSTQKHTLALTVVFALPIFEQPLDQHGTAKATVTSVGLNDSAGVDPDGTLTAPLK